MTPNAQPSTAKTIHTIFSGLWSLLSTKRLAVIVDSAEFHENSAGFFLNEPPKIDAYLSSLPKLHPARAFLDYSETLSLIVVDPAAALPLGGWNEFLLTALHEFAHAARADLANGLYPSFAALREVTDYVEMRIKTSTGHDEDLPMSIFVTDQDLSDIDCHLFEVDGLNPKPLFGKWAVRTVQHDGNHDLLFYLITYFLEREAVDRGHFFHGTELVRSVYLPERIDAVLSAPTRRSA
ncbi:MAG: hypothetical protein D3M94_22265 [Rhodocyclales bacterium GT-UBC]|nr:MAG: hypothetical protein D3M94_22265 [Rhodocyclales bacterium GT-UBC]